MTSKPRRDHFGSACVGVLGFGMGLLGMGLLTDAMPRYLTFARHPAPTPFIGGLDTPSRGLPSVTASVPPTAADKSATDRSSAVIQAFVQACGLGRPDADRVSDRVGRMNLTKRMLVSRPIIGGGVTVRKVWTGALGEDLLGVFVDETKGRRFTTSGCAVASKVADVDGFRNDLVESLKLVGSPVTKASDDKRSFEWKGAMGAGTDFTLRDIAGERAVMISLVSQGATEQPQ